RDYLCQHLLGRSRAAVFHQLRGVHATAVEVRLVFLPVFVEALDQVLETDRDGAAFVVLDLHRWTVEAQQLPHLLGRDRDGSRLQLLQELVGRLAQRKEHQCVLWQTVGEGGKRSDDGCATFELEVGTQLSGGG